MQPKLVIKSHPIDFELTELLGERPSDFLVLCFDGVQLDDFGTPYDTPRNRADRQGLVDRLNDRSKNSLWPEMWRNWKPQICKQFELPDTTTDEGFRPVVSYEISRVCAGYSQHLHVAIGLFETISDKIFSWRIRKAADDVCHVEIRPKRGAPVCRRGAPMALTIAESVHELLTHAPKQ